MPDQGNKNNATGTPAPDAGQPSPSALTEDALKHILVSSGHAYVIWIPGDPNPYISESLATFLGYFPNTFAVAGISGLIRYVHKRDRAPLLSLLDTVTRHGGEFDSDFRLRAADGNYHWFRFSGSCYEQDDNGLPTRLIGYISDINDLKCAQIEAEQEIDKSEWLRNISAQLIESRDADKYSHALTGLADRLACTHAYLRLRHPVSGVQEIVAESVAVGQQPIRQIVNESTLDALHVQVTTRHPQQEITELSVTDDQSATHNTLLSALDLQHLAIIPLAKSHHIEGELCLLSTTPILHNERDRQLAKEFSQLVSLIFEREAIAVALSESDERFHLAMQASRDGLWDAQIGLDRVYVSPSYFRMTGNSQPGGIYPREITGKFVHPDDLLMVRENLARFVQSDKDNDSIEFRMKHVDGSAVWVLSRMYKAEFDANGMPTRVIGVNTDITEFKRIQEVLKTAQTEADSANQAKSEFLAKMSHEIRTPMNAILGLSHLLLESNLQTEQRNHVKHIDDAGQLLLSIINDILDFSKIEAGKLELDDTEFNLEKVVNRLGNLFIYSAEEKQIRFVIDLEANVPTLLIGDVTRLQQILVNLLNNAIKFTNTGGVYLKISVAADNRIAFAIEDTGIGIDEQDRQFLFSPFSQADGSVTRRYGGTGLGLAICKHLVEMMGGTIEVESAIGKGSIFSFSLPFATQPHSKSLPDATATTTIALISNDPGTLHAANNLFSRYCKGTIHQYTSFQDFATSQTCQQNCLCVIDNQTITESELNSHITGQKNQPEISHRYVYLCDNNQFHQRNRNDYTAFRALPKPLTPTKVNTLLFPEKSDIDVIKSESLKTQWQRYNVLLAEDNTINQKVALGILKLFGLTADVVNDGQQAIERLRQYGPKHYDVVLMDMEMPTLDGYAATRIIRQDPSFSELPIVAMTAHAMKGDRDRCLDAGMDDYISKPINPTLLYETLSKFLPTDE